MRTLYHFPLSPFSRRTRLALMHKKLQVDLKDARANEKHREEARAIWPLRTIPVFVDDDGTAMGDSTAITHYLDVAYPNEPALWPTSRVARGHALAIAKLVDGALDTIVDVGTRYYPLRTSEQWNTVSAEMLGRAQDALDALATRVEGAKGEPLAGPTWSAADIWMYAAVAWLEGLPARAPTNQNIAQIMTLRWQLPESLSRWAQQHAKRDDVRALE